MFNFGGGGGGHSFDNNTVCFWSTINGLFANEELDVILRSCLSLDLVDGKIGQSQQPNDYRKSSIRFIYPSEDTSVLFSRITSGIQQVNSSDYRFDLHGLHEGLQFTRYTDDGGHYGWHVDIGMNIPVRKLSISLQLSKSEDYDGGDLQFQFGSEIVTAPRDHGVAIIFPSYVLHRVTPVTRGTRYSLVGWVAGPAFK